MSSPIAFEAPATGTGSKLEHAVLVLYEPSSDGSQSAPGPEIARVAFQFNPRELALSKGTEWRRQTTRADDTAGPVQFQASQPSRLSLEVFLDASQEKDTAVVKAVERLFTTTVPTPTSLSRKKPSPPWVRFRWGSLTSFLAYVSSVRATYTLFTRGGVPIRATVALDLEQITGPVPRQNPTSGTPLPQRRHVLVEGDTLAGVAYREYGDPHRWRAVAQANGIDDPFSLRPGQVLMLPAVDELRRLTGGRDDAR